MKPFTSLHTPSPAPTLRRGPVRFAVLLLTLAAACSRAPQGARPKADYDPQTGRLRRFEFDSNHDGKYDTVSYMDGTRIVRVELDLDQNGKVERWDFYTPDRKLEKVGFASKNDGVMDSQAFYQPGTGEAAVLQRIEISTRRDGKFDRTEFYDNGRLVRSADDTNGDGRADKWDTWEPVDHPNTGSPQYGITSTSFDDSGSGRPERRFIYGAGGAIVRVEVDPKGDGHWVLRPAAPILRASTRTR